MIYFITFIISGLFANLSFKTASKKNKFKFFLCAGISIFIPSILAGLRDFSIGTDVQTYFVPQFNLSRSCASLHEYLGRRLSTGNELFFRSLLYFVGRFTDDAHWALFAVELIIMTCVFKGCYDHRDKVNASFLFIIYLFTYYNLSFNLIRQSIAMAIVFGYFSYLEQSKYRQFAAAVIVASLFHSSSILLLSMIAVHYFITKGKLREKALRKLLVIAGVCLLCVSIRAVVYILIGFGFISNRWLAYVNGRSVSDELLNTIIYGFECIWLLLNAKQMDKKDDNLVFLRLNTYITFILLQLGKIFYYGSRMSLDFAIINLYTVSYLPMLYYSAKNRRIMRAVIIFVVLFRWWYIYILNRSGQTYPYIFA